MALVHTSLIHGSTYNSTISFNNCSNNCFTFLFLGLVSKDLSINGLEVKVRKIHYLVMMLHLPPTKQLKTLEVLDELEIREAIRLQKLGDHFLTLLVSLQKGSLNFLIFLNDVHLFHLQCILELLHLLLGLYSLIYHLDQVLPQL